jgi:hypothetical protein
VSAKLKLLFDECLGKPAVVALGALLAASGRAAELSHVLDYQSQGVPDQLWIPRLAPDEWIILTADRGKRCKGQKLALVCQQFSVTHVMLSAAIHHKKTLDKVSAVLHVWSEIERLPTEPKGSGFSLRLSQGGQAKLVRLY